MQVQEVMTVPVETTAPSATLRDATATMLDGQVGCVVAVDSAPVGILTRSDVLRAVHHTGDRLGDRTVGEVMSEPLVTTAPERAVESALGSMQSRGVKKLPVVDGVELVGIVTLTDVAHSLPDRVSEVRASLTRKDDWTD